MAEYLGKDMYAQWIWSGGTITLHDDFRTFAWTPSAALHDGTSGPDAAQHQVVGIQNASASIGLVDQTGASGTIYRAALAFGNIGTLIVGAQGTTVGSPRITLPAMSQGAKVNAPYNDLVEITCDFIQEGGVYTEDTY